MKKHLQLLIGTLEELDLFGVLFLERFEVFARAPGVAFQFDLGVVDLALQLLLDLGQRFDLLLHRGPTVLGLSTPSTDYF